jgi:hypothetical protein
MAIYTKLFASGTQAIGSSTVFTAPADGFTYVIRDIRVGTNGAGATAAAIVTTAGAYLMQAPFTFVNETAGVELRQVLPAGQGIIVVASGASMGYTITGYRLAP